MSQSTSPELDRPVYVHSIATTVPEHRYRQKDIGEILGRHLPERSKARRLMNRIYRHSGIDYRHSVIPDFRTHGPDGHFFTDDSGTFGSPTTATRNDLYTRAAREIFRRTAVLVLERADADPARVSHVITVSCTGFFAPGPDFYLVKDLGMSPGTERFHIGFMGCYAAFPAMKMARSICRADAEAVVLVVCLELCTLHLQTSDQIDDIIATSVFADGAAGILVRADPPAERPGLQMNGFSSVVAPESEEDMAWSVGDNGFDMVLSTYVPKVLEQSIAPAVDDLLGNLELGRRDIDRWAIHPGGRAILDHVSRALDLADNALEEAREVLRLNGNMSSPTILFVLARMLEEDESGGAGSGAGMVDSPGREVSGADAAAELPDTGVAGPRRDRIFAAAFGPGLTVESGVFTRVGA